MLRHVLFFDANYLINNSTLLTLQYIIKIILLLVFINYQNYH
jgi:hypothetical protein